jgi:hypothetical protein
MSLHQQIKQEAQDALKAHEETRLSVLRGIVSECTNENVRNKRKPDVELSDEDVMSIITRLAKQRKDSMAQFKKGGREDLVEKEAVELALLEAYLPQMMSLDEIRPLAKAKKEELGITDRTEKGKLMGALMGTLKGKADGNDVKTIVDELFG